MKGSISGLPIHVLLQNILLLHGILMQPKFCTYRKHEKHLSKVIGRSVTSRHGGAHRRAGDYVMEHGEAVQLQRAAEGPVMLMR